MTALLTLGMIEEINRFMTDCLLIPDSGHMEERVSRANSEAALRVEMACRDRNAI